MIVITRVDGKESNLEKTYCVKVTNKLVFCLDGSHSHSFCIISTCKHHSFIDPRIQNSILFINTTKKVYLFQSNPAIFFLFQGVNDLGVTLPFWTYYYYCSLRTRKTYHSQFHLEWKYDDNYRVITNY